MQTKQEVKAESSRPTKSDADPITISVKRAQHLSGFGHSKMAELIRDGRLRSTKVDGKRLVYFESLKQLLGLPVDGAAVGAR